LINATDEAAFLSDLLGPKPFNNDDVLNQGDHEDLENDPVYQMDMNVFPESTPPST
jgi:hypothetical protein